MSWFIENIDLILVSVGLIIFAIIAYKNGLRNTVAEVVREVEYTVLTKENIDKLDKAILKLNQKSIIIKYLINNNYLEKLIEQVIKWSHEVNGRK